VPAVTRTENRKRLARAVAPVAALSIIVAACGDDSGTTTDTTAEGGSGEVSGDIFVSGSSTVEPISVRVAELLEDSAPDVNVDVEGPGTGDGFELFCNGESDISDASRAISPEEIESCQANGIEFVELLVAYDGLTVMTNPANDAVECLSFADLYALVGPESQGKDNWQDAQALASELGSSTAFPDAPLDITGPGEESGTYDAFVELALGGIIEERGREEATRPDYSSQANDNAIIQGIEGSDSSFGWVGFAFAEQAGDGVQEIAVSEEPGGDCVSPSIETISDGSYPLSRPLFIYVDAAKAESNPAIAAYVDFYFGDGISAVEEVGYVALPDDTLTETRARWDARETGAAAG
jgi:phosphate transport system substrate-binding protein